MRLRPTFRLELAEPYAAVAGRLRTGLRGERFEVKWARTPGSQEDALRDERDHAVLCLRPEFRHFWSPWLHLEVQGDATATRVLGQFSPHPSVWSGFAFGYLALSVIAFFSLVFAAAQLLLGTAPWASGIAAGCLGIGLGMAWASQVGQGLAAAQMELLREALDGALAGAAQGGAELASRTPALGPRPAAALGA